MSVFWIGAAVIITVVLLALIVPLFRSPSGGESQRSELNARVYQARLQELERERDEGRVSLRVFDQMRLELQRTLLDDVAQHRDPKSTTRRSNLLAAIATVITMVGLGTAYFYQAGLSGNVADWSAVQARTAESVDDFLRNPETLPSVVGEDPDAFARSLQARLLRDNSRNPREWFTLGTINLRLQRPLLAVPALERALELDDDNVATRLALAQGLIQRDDGRLTEASRSLLVGVLNTKPDHQGALLTLGLGAVNSGDYDTAIDAWEQALALIPESAEGSDLLRRSIETAKRQRDQGTAPTGAPSITVTVDLDPELTNHLPDDGTVFVFAKAVSGPPMPLAVVRQPLDKLPITVRLDDSRSMSPALKLSSVKAVTVGARISRSGTANASPGDLEGRSDPVELSDTNQEIKIQIDSRVE